MTLSPSQAADSLKDIEQTSQRSAFAYGYAQSSPYFLIWGIAWMFGYAGSDLLLRLARSGFITLLWLVLVLAAVAACAVTSRRQYYRGRSGAELAKARAIGNRIGASTVIVYLFVAATFLVLRPRNPAASGAFIPLVLATYYALFGIWKGLRFLVIGAALAILTLGGFFLLSQYFLLWMAAVGGGSLILFGLWLKRL